MALPFCWKGVRRASRNCCRDGGETVGAQFTADARVRGVMFTGSTEVATLLQRNIATRLDSAAALAPLIAENRRYVNAAIVDSSALTEQVVVDAGFRWLPDTAFSAPRAVVWWRTISPNIRR